MKLTCADHLDTIVHTAIRNAGLHIELQESGEWLIEVMGLCEHTGCQHAATDYRWVKGSRVVEKRFLCKRHSQEEACER